MNLYIDNWFYVIRNCSVDNTYKMGWSKSIIECCVENPKEKIISFDRISLKMFKYYWNQIIFFELRQGSNPVKPPELYSYVKQIIQEYQNEHGPKPVLFDKIAHKLNIDVNRINRILKKDVCHRFLKVAGKVFDLYELDKDRQWIQIYHPILLKEYSDFFFELINYKWTQILEGFNSSPRISKKVKIVDFKKVPRNSLQKYHKYLQLFDNTCFICDKKIDGVPSIDHVIPWSYMYSDDLWNLVYSHKKCNSSKSNRIVGEMEIQKLELRNKALLEKLIMHGIEDKHTEELRLSLEKDFTRKFWIGFKG